MNPILQLLKSPAAPSISVYAPVSTLQDRAALRTLTHEIESALGGTLAPQEARTLLEPLHELQAYPGTTSDSGVALFLAPGTSVLVPLRFKPQQRWFVSDSFHLKPILASLQHPEETETLLYLLDASRSERPYVSSIADIARAAAEGRVDHLVIAGDLERRGTLDRRTGHVRFDTAAAEDLLDDLAELVLAGDGSVTVAPAHRLPDGLPAIAWLKG